MLQSFVHFYSTVFEMDFDLRTYIERIGLNFSELKHDFETLKMIQLADMQRIPFENMDIVNRKTISTDISDICNKILKHKRGGYCYEKNILLMTALRMIGYDVTPMLSRVLWMTPGVVNPFTHLILIVKLNDCDYLVDVGFGGLGSTVPLELVTDKVQITDAPYRLIESPNNYKTLQIRISDSWNDIYRFQINPVLDCDIIQTNWYSCTYPGAKWCTCLYACHVVGLDRVYIYNSEFCTRKASGELIKNKIKDSTELLKLLKEEFGIVLDFVAQNAPETQENIQKLKKFEEYASTFLNL